MCGIAGVFTPPGNVEPRVLVRMAIAMEHRGPDDEGFFLANATETRLVGRAEIERGGADDAPWLVGFAHRRLAIIDPAGGAQPMVSSRTGACLAYNGEIYNHRELREWLRRRGHAFAGRSDTEVLLRLYDEVGTDLVHHVNGIFAFALWDPRRMSLVLARDRMGVKPLYVARTAHGSLSFASEIDTLLRGGGVPRIIDPVGVVEHFTLQNVLGGRTLLASVEQIEPATLVVTDRTGRSRSQRYWTMDAPSATGAASTDVAGDLAEILDQVVNDQLVADVEVGSYLSGGLDSSTLAAIAVRSRPNLPTFTVGFDASGLDDGERSFDEIDVARRLAGELGTVHRERRLSFSGRDSDIRRVIDLLDEPRMGISYQIPVAAELARRSVSVVLSGVGADEMFGGYPWRYEPFMPGGPCGDGTDFEEAAWDRWQRLVPEREHPTFFGPALQDVVEHRTVRSGFLEIARRHQGASPLFRAMQLDRDTFLHGLLTIEDKLSMAHSVETRAPYTDDRVLDFVAGVPAETLTAVGEHKRVLRLAARSWLPRWMFARPKVGFTPPEAAWLRMERRPGWVDEVLCGAAVDHGFLSPAAVQSIVSDHAAGHRNHRQLLWSLRVFESWCRRTLDSSVDDGVSERDVVADAPVRR